MRSFILILIAVDIFSLAIGHAATVDQRITAVTVYPDRALITRSGTVALAPGVQTVVFDHLPLNLEEDSVRARAASHTSMKILGIEMRRDYREVAPTADMKKLQDEVTKLGDQIRALTDEQRDLGNRNDFLLQIKNRVASPPAGQGEKEGSAPNLQALFTLYATESAKVTTRLREIDFLLRDLNRQNQDKAGQLALLQQPTEPNTRSALVTIDAGGGGAVDVDVTYLISGAAWQPQYDAYADPDSRKVELTYYGVVRQTTGEDWAGVALTLSSSRPSVAARLPEMQPWAIDFAVAMMETDRSEKESQSDELRAINSTAQASSAPPSGTAASGDRALDLPAPMLNAQVLSLGPAATFAVLARTSIPSDGQPHRNAISVQGMKGEWTYEASPKLASGAFLKTRVTNGANGPLLGGNINVFLGNNFVGKSNIGLVAPGASFDLFLGVDENIKVTRTEGVNREETGGILSRQRIYKRSYEVEIENFKTSEIDLTLHDQVPVSKNGAIAVNLSEVQPSVEKQNADTGEMTWKIKLRPGQSQKFNVAYEVSAPYDKPVGGV